MLPVLANESWHPSGIEVVGFNQIHERQDALLAYQSPGYFANEDKPLRESFYGTAFRLVVQFLRPLNDDAQVVAVWRLERRLQFPRRPRTPLSRP